MQPNRGVPLVPWNAPGANHRDWPPENRGVPLDTFHDPNNNPQWALHSAHQEELRVRMQNDREIAALRAQLALAREQIQELSKHAPADPTIANPPTQESSVPRDWTLSVLLDRFETMNPKLLIEVMYKRSTLFDTCTATDCTRVLMAITRVRPFYKGSEPPTDTMIVPELFHWLTTETQTTILASRAQFEENMWPFLLMALALGRYRELQFTDFDPRFPF